MSGDIKLPKDQLKSLDDILDEYESTIGLPKKDAYPSMEKYFNPAEDVSVFTAEQCGEHALALSRYSFFLQRRYNTEVARLNWAESTLNQYTNIHAEQYIGGYKSIDERKSLVIKNDNYATKLLKIRDYAKQKANRLFGLSGKVDNIVKSLLELQNTRRRG